MGRLWQRDAVPLLSHHHNLPRTWEGKSSRFALVHPFSGSDATSRFSGKGNKSAWKAWKTYPTATARFTSASQGGFDPLEFTSAAFRLIGRFTCIMYDSTTSYDKENDLRQEASNWRNSLKPITAAANPEVFGWSREDTGWRAAAVGCRELIKCGCKTEHTCAKKSRCKTAGLMCTALCLYRGLCES